MHSSGSLAQTNIYPSVINATAKSPAPQTGPASILWLTDQPDHFEQFLLKNAVKVADKALVWQMIDNEEFDDCLIILGHTDCQINFDFCTQLRGHRNHYDVPTIMLVPDNDTAIEAIKIGSSDFCLLANTAAELPARVQQCWLNHVHARHVALQLDEQRKEIVNSHLLTEKIVDSLPVSLYVVDKSMHIVAWNRSREIGGQGIERQQVIGRHVQDVFSKMPYAKLENEFRQVFTTGQALRFEQESKSEGQMRYWYISKFPIRVNEESDEVTHVMTIGEEITEQKNMNAAVIHSEKLAGIGRMASGVVHEINNPLATIAACTEALQMRLDETEVLPSGTQEDFHEYLKLVHDETFRCKTITNNLLEFARHRESEKSVLEINFLVEQTLRLVKHHPKLKRLQVEISFSENLPSIKANEAQIKQVFIALITNACDAVDEITGQLWIRTGLQKIKEKEFIYAEFSDNGGGIPAEMLTKIFEPFVTTKAFGQGTGLGLAVCYGIVSDHDGKIEVSSQVGQGTTMKVLLPIAAKE